MSSKPVDHRPTQTITDDALINVAALLQDDLGARRTYGVRLSRVPLTDDIVAPHLEGLLNLTRLRGQILASFDLEGGAILECVRCLRPYEQPVSARFEEPFRQRVDVRSGAEIRADDQLDPAEDDFFEITENHGIDIREAIRQNILLALPMRPDCGDDCPGPDLATLRSTDDDDTPADGRFAALSALLDEGAPPRG